MRRKQGEERRKATAERKREEKRLGVQPEEPTGVEADIETWEEGDFDADFGYGGG